MRKYWMAKEIAATTKKIGITLAKEYEHALMQKLLDSEVSISIMIIMPIRYNGSFVMMLAILCIISCILSALNDSIRNNSL
jgi:hypothetical protein